MLCAQVRLCRALQPADVLSAASAIDAKQMHVHRMGPRWTKGAYAHAVVPWQQRAPIMEQMTAALRELPGRLARQDGRRTAEGLAGLVPGVSVPHGHPAVPAAFGASMHARMRQAC